MHKLASRILFEDNHLIIINKMPGELVQADKTGDATLADTVQDYLRVTYGKQGNIFLGIPAPDRSPASGIVRLCEDGEGLGPDERALFSEQEDVQKTYLGPLSTACPPETRGWCPLPHRDNGEETSLFATSPTSENSKRPA